MHVAIEKMMRIDVYSHFFKVSKFTPRVQGILFTFSSKYTHHSFVQRQAKEATVPKTYACQTLDNLEFRFHIGQLKPFLESLGYQHITTDMYDLIEHPIYKPADINVGVKPGWVLREQQQEASDFIIQEDSTDFHTRLATLPTGSGKSQPLDAKIKIPGGWTTIGDIKVGDVVTTWSGNASYVNGVYPQGIRPVYRVTFEDGRSVKCDAEHLWEIFPSSYAEENARVITTLDLKEIRDNQKYSEQLVRLPLSENTVEYNEGLPNTYSYGKLFDFSSESSAIDEKYLHSSHVQRVLLLKGLLRSHLFRKYGIRFLLELPSKQLANDIVYLVRSISGTGIATKIGNTYSVECTHPEMESFYAEDEINTIDYNDKSGYFIDVKSVEYVGEEECTCISINDPSKLYVTDDFIVTHNTVLSIVSVLNKTIRGRVLVVVLPKYQEKWKGDIVNISTANPKRVMGISGSDQVKGLIQMGQERPKELPDVIVLSLTTIQNFFKAYEENRFSDEFKDFGCLPEEFCSILGIGNIIIDETHEHLFSVYKFMCYTHVPKIVALSGTVISDDPFIQKMHHIMFPKEIRFDKIKMKKYIKVYPISYRYNNYSGANIRTTEHGSRNYSQIAYEKSVIKLKHILEGYLKLVGMVTDIAYIHDFKEKDKLAVYAGSIAMCDILLDFLKKRYKHLDVRRYVEQDPYVNVIEAQIRVTTILSAGTALDIPDLRAVVMTNSINSPVSNLQILGRLRELKDRDVKFFYLYCLDIQKQVDYHHRRMDLFADRVAVIKEFKAPISL